MMPNNYPQLAAEIITQLAPDFKPQLGLILGSGLGDVAEKIERPVKIPYQQLPGFPVTTVSGHCGQLVLGYLSGVAVACFRGRVHSYEGTSSQAYKTFIRTMRLIGCTLLIITNSSGSLREEVGPGELVLITDHINLQPGNPLAGANEEEFGPRFFSMNDAYDPQLRKKIHEAAQEIGIKLVDGVYVGVLGPCFETPAEIKAFRILGADVVGMSTVPEVLVARHCGLKVAAISVITNYAAGLSPEAITHEGTLHYGQMGCVDLSRLLIKAIGDLKDEL